MTLSKKGYNLSIQLLAVLSIHWQLNIQAEVSIMKVFVTGASGFIGSAVIKRLAENGHDVTGLVRKAEQADAIKGIGAKDLVVGDLLDPYAFASAVKESDLVVSLSSPIKKGERLSFLEARRRSYYHGQMVGNLFLAAQGSKVKGIMVGYGVQGFGNCDYRWIDERNELAPAGFDRSISGAFWHIDKTSRKTRVPLVNIFSGSAYGQGGWFADMAQGIQDGSAKIVGSGENLMSLIHIDDLATAYCNLVEKMPIGERICLVDENPVTQKKLMQFVAESMGCGAPSCIDAGSYAEQKGEVAAESALCSARVSCKRMKATVLPQMQYPSFEEGVPNVLAALSIGAEVQQMRG